ncbi:MAG: PEP-CTERM sorting domain-containing protein [Burkholderiales bacterium]|nr:PEP-CTERM sorting domain-containing protein [Burkholderiales bacterium]
MPLDKFPFRSLLGAVVVGAALAASSLPAQASFLSGVSVRLIAPGGIQGTPVTSIDTTQSVALADLATGIFQGDNGAIGGNNLGTFGYMLIGETIFFDSATNSIRLHVAGGSDDGTTITTGYLGNGTGHARYEISGLDIGAAITGFQSYAFNGYGTSGTSGLLSPTTPADYIQISGNTLVFDLDQLTFVRPASGGSDAFAEFRINLTTDPGTGGGGGGGGGGNLPEPATLALFAIAALGARAARRRA